MVSPVEAAPTAWKRLAENGAFVLFAYFLAFGIWTAASGNDFISSNWKTVRRTRRRGQMHVIFVFVPMIYMTVYIVAQQRNGDYQEMGAALLALAFAVLHLIRTVVGLWQLLIFKKWTISSIKSMESLGYEARVQIDDSDARHVEDIDHGSSSDQEGQAFNLHWLFYETGSSSIGTVEMSSDSDQSGTGISNDCDISEKSDKAPSEPQQARIERLADEILVKEILIDNRLSDVYTACYVRLLSEDEERAVYKESSRVKRLCCRVWYSMRSILRLAIILVSLTFLKTPRLPNSKSGPRLLPRHPETVWIRWATALVAQADWMRSFDIMTIPIDPDLSVEYVPHRDSFAENILMSAALHSCRTGGETSRYERDPSTMPRFLDFQDWRKYPQLCKGKFSKQEFLQRACRTGCGLPYEAPHRKAFVLRRGLRRCSYENFNSELSRAREALPADIEAHVNSFTIEKLEWFTIFVSVENWASNHVEKANAEFDKLAANSDEYSDSKDDGRENDLPVENLRKQLGFSKESDFSLCRFRFPLLRNIHQRILWGNRNLLQISCHIDNWLALCAGEQAAYMVKHVPWMDRKCLGDTMNGMTAGQSAGAGAANGVISSSLDLERCKFLCQMAMVKPEDSHFDKSLTFLRCSMEMLRSSLCKWMEKAEHVDESTWKPNQSFENECENIVQFTASEDLSACLRCVENISNLTERYVQMRVLWELQDHFHGQLPECGAAPNSLEAIVLCVLSFPAVSMEIREISRSKVVSKIMERREEHCVLDMEMKDDPKFDIEDFEYAVRASCGPQDLFVTVSFSSVNGNSIPLVSAKICRIDEAQFSSFEWQAWRDSFYGRLEGTRKMQEQLGIAHLPVLRSTSNIWLGLGKREEKIAGTGSAMNVWKGWMPYRPAICMYEIATDGFVMQPVPSGNVNIDVTMSDAVGDTFTIPREVWAPVSYQDADPLALKHASLVGHELLAGLADGEDSSRQGLKDTMTRAEKLIENEPDAGNGLALLLLQVAAVGSGNTVALEKAINLLMGSEWTSKAITRGVELLERFYISDPEGAQGVAWNPSCLFRFCEDESRVKVVVKLFEKLFVESNYEHFVAERYTRFTLMHSQYGKVDQSESTYISLFKALVLRGHLQEHAKAAFAISDFSRMLSRFPEEFAVKHLTCLNLLRENGIAGIDTIPAYSVDRWRETKAEMMSDFGTSIRILSREEGGKDILRMLGLDLKSALDFQMRAIQVSGQHFTTAITSLAAALEEGGDGVERDVARATRLYQDAIDHGQDVVAMVRLADLICSNAELLGMNSSNVIELYQRAIDEGGSVRAMVKLGNFLETDETGNGVSRAVELYQRAIDEGRDANAMNSLAFLLAGQEHGVRYVKRAVELYSKAISEWQFSPSMYNLAILLLHGAEGVEVDVARALELLNMAADKGDDALYETSLADILRKGSHGCERDIPRAMSLYENAVEKWGNFHAMHELAVLLIKNEDGGLRNGPRAVELFTRAALDGNYSLSMNNLGFIFATGRYGVAKDVPRAKEYFTKAYEKSENVHSLIGLADLLIAGGDGVDKDIRYAIRLYEHAIHKHQSSHAMNRLALLLEKGAKGLEKDLARAADLYRQAISEHQSVTSMSLLGLLLARGGDGVKKNVFQAMSLFEEAIKGGSVVAMTSLADLLQKGDDGVEKDLSRAKYLYHRAASLGQNMHAKEQIALLGDYPQPEMT